MKYILSLVIALFSHFIINGQDSTSYDHQLWLEGLIDYQFGQKWDFFSDASYRRVCTRGEDAWRVMARPSLKWKVLNWLDVRGGIGFFLYAFR